MLKTPPMLREETIPSQTARVPSLALLLTNNEAAEYVGISPSKLRAMASAGNFPRPVKLPGCKSTRWRRVDIDKWVASLSPRAA